MDKWDTIGIIGALLVSAGIWWVYAPCGLISVGAFILAIYALREFAAYVPQPRDKGSESGDNDSGDV